MRRRRVIALLSAAAASEIARPFPAWAQQASPVRRVAVILGSAENSEGHTRVNAFQQTLQSLGWTEGQNLQLDVRWSAAEANRGEDQAKASVAFGPDVIFAEATPVVAALLQETRTIPIVFVNVSDPVGSGFAASLARPGGTVTGFISNEPALGGKWLQLLKEIAPPVKRAGLMFNPPAAPYVGPFLKSFESAAGSLGVEPRAAPVADRAAIETAFAATAGKAGEGFVVLADIFTTVHQAEIVASAARHRVPTLYPFAFFARNGGLAAYGADVVDLFRRAAGYIDRILRGETAANLPVQAPTKFEFVINLKTARVLGLDISSGMLASADEVIE